MLADVDSQAAARLPAHPARLDITVLAGGPSAERDVSLCSGQAVADALRSRGHVVELADIGPDNLSALDRTADVVFPALHGTFGEDGHLQRILESRGLRFVGSGSRASAMAMDKAVTKREARAVGVPTPAFAVADRDSTVTWTGPVVVKPVDQGSSVMTTIVREAGALEATVRAVCERFGRALIEEFVSGDELTVGILGDVTLPPICVRPAGEFYDYSAKYVVDTTEYAFNSHAPAVLAEAQELSRRIFDRLGCRHLARVDWMIGRDARLWMLEVNTMPGFTAHSLLPKAAAKAGIPFAALCERLVMMAREGA